MRLVAIRAKSPRMVSEASVEYSNVAVILSIAITLFSALIVLQIDLRHPMAINHSPATSGTYARYSPFSPCLYIYLIADLYISILERPRTFSA